MAFLWMKKKHKLLSIELHLFQFGMCNNFLGFVNFYRIFINDYSKIAIPLTCLTKKENFVWNEKAEEAFEALKKAYILAPILVRTNSLKPFS